MKLKLEHRIEELKKIEPRKFKERACGICGGKIFAIYFYREKLTDREVLICSECDTLWKVVQNEQSKAQ